MIKFKFKMSHKLHHDKSQIIGTSSWLNDEHSSVLNVSLIVLELLEYVIIYRLFSNKKKGHYNVIIYILFSM